MHNTTTDHIAPEPPRRDREPASLAALPLLDPAERATILAGLHLLSGQYSLATVAPDQILTGPALELFQQRLAALDYSAPVARIMVALDGGLVSGIAADRPIILTTIDYDVEGVNDDRIIEVPQDHGKVADTVIGHWAIEAIAVDPAWIDRVEHAITAAQAE